MVLTLPENCSGTDGVNPHMQLLKLIADADCDPKDIVDLFKRDQSLTGSTAGNVQFCALHLWPDCDVYPAGGCVTEIAAGA